MPLARGASVSGDATRLQIIRRGSGPAGESRTSMAKKAAPKVTNAKATATPKAAPSAADTSAAARPRPASKTAVYTRLAEMTGLRRKDITGERSISFGSRGDPCCSRKCLPLKMIPASRLVIRT